MVQIDSEVIICHFQEIKCKTVQFLGTNTFHHNHMVCKSLDLMMSSGFFIFQFFCHAIFPTLLSPNILYSLLETEYSLYVQYIYAIMVQSLVPYIPNLAGYFLCKKPRSVDSLSTVAMICTWLILLMGEFSGKNKGNDIGLENDVLFSFKQQAGNVLVQSP